MRALVVDDEPPACAELSYLLGQDGRFTEVLVADSGTEALLVLESQQIDVVFSDISMPGLNGVELARVVARFAHRPQIVFVTAHEKYAVDAFAVQATDYVMKPVHPQRLARAVDRVVHQNTRLRQAGTAPARPGIADAGSAAGDRPSGEDEQLAVELGGVTRFVPVRDIRYAQAQGDYVRLHTVTGSHLVRAPLASLEERWAERGFVRVHRSTLVALAHVDQVRHSGGRTTLLLRPDGTQLAVSRRHSRDVRDRIMGRGGPAGDRPGAGQ